jgi:protein-disulfide isomerase
MTRIARALAATAFAVVAIAATGNWNATVARTDGAHVIGNPAAKTKVTEFVSYTCPHCANFEKEAGGAIKLGWVQTGKVALEVRHIVRDPIDLTVAMLTNCGSKDKFYQNHTMFMLSQDKWLGKAQLALPSQQQRWRSGTMPQRWRAMAADLGFYEMMETRGYTRVQVDQCLGDEAAAKRIAEQSESNGTKYGVTGTPSFALNGKLLSGVHTWDALREAVKP